MDFKLKNLPQDLTEEGRKFIANLNQRINDPKMTEIVVIFSMLDIAIMYCKIRNKSRSQL